MPGPANALNISQEGLTYFDGVNTFTGVPGVTAGFVLTDNGLGVSPTFQASSGGGIVTINGDSGSSVTGSTVTIATGQTTQNSGSSVGFSGSVSTLTLNLSDSNLNTILGNSSGNVSITGQANVGLGFDCLRNISSGTTNVAIGSSCNSSSNTSNNVAIGNASLYQYAGSNSIGIGKQIGFAVTGGTNSGSYNVYIGDLVASTNSGSSNSNVGIGANSLQSVSDGSFNTSSGINSLLNLTTGSYNISLGSSAGISYIGSESSNICLANSGVASENNVIRIGTQGTGNGQQSTCYIAGIYNNDSSGFSSPLSVFVDSSTGQLGFGSGGGGGIVTINGDNGSITGSTVTIKTGTSTQNCGASVSFTNSSSTSILNVTDSNLNTMIGNLSGNATITGFLNCFYGPNTGFNLTTGQSNNFFGYGSGIRVDAGSFNQIFGQQAGPLITSGSNNVLMGHKSALTLSTGSSNTILGDQTAGSLDTGNFNTIVGVQSGGAYSASESSNILLGNPGVNGESNVMRLGNSGSGTGQVNKCFIAGITGVTVTGVAVLCDTNGQLGTVLSSEKFKENIQDISSTKQSILDCRPVSFNYKSDSEKTKCFGMIAEEVEQVFPDLVLYKDESPYSIKYQEMPALLLAEIQRLNIRIAKLEDEKTKH